MNPAALCELVTIRSRRLRAADERRRNRGEAGGLLGQARQLAAIHARRSSGTSGGSAPVAALGHAFPVDVREARLKAQLREAEIAAGYLANELYGAEEPAIRSNLGERLAEARERVAAFRAELAAG